MATCKTLEYCRSAFVRALHFAGVKDEKTNEIRHQCRLNGWKAAVIESMFATKTDSDVFYADGGPEALDIVKRVLAGDEILAKLYRLCRRILHQRKPMRPFVA